MARRLRDQDGNDLNDDMAPQILEQQHADMPDGQVHIMYNRNYRFPNLVDFDKTSKDPEKYFQFVAEQHDEQETFLDRDASLIMQEPFPLEPYKTVKDVILKMGSQFESIYFISEIPFDPDLEPLAENESFQRGPEETKEHYCERIIRFVQNSSRISHAKHELPNFNFRARDYNWNPDQDEALYSGPRANETVEEIKARDELKLEFTKGKINHYRFDCTRTIISFLLALRLPVVYRMTPIKRDRQYFQFPTLVYTVTGILEFHYHFFFKREYLDHAFKGVTDDEFGNGLVGVGREGFLYPAIRNLDSGFYELQEFARLAHNACKAFNSGKQEMARDTGIQLPASILTFQDMRRLIQQNRK